MKEINLKIRISNKTSKVMFKVDKNYKDNTGSILEFVGVLDLIKNAYLEKLGEVMRREMEKETSYGE